MNNDKIIQQLIGEIQEVFTEGFREVIRSKDYAEFNKNYANKSIKVLQKALGCFYEYLDIYLKESEYRKKEGYIVKDKVNKNILTCLGNINYTKTVYVDKTNKTRYLLDEYVGIKPNERLMDDARESIIKEVIDNSYRKAGLRASILDSVHKQTVKNLVMEVEIPKEIPKMKQKKEIDILYIEADEDHVALQDKFKKKKSNRRNGIIDKLIYCFEGKELEAPKSKRKRLINAHYFAGVYSGAKRNQDLWEEVYSYIDNTYDISKIKKIYISGDGASWIREGLQYFNNAIFVMDEFHIMKYIRQSTSVLKDSQEEGMSEIYRAIRNNNKTEIENIFGRIYNICKTKEERKNIDSCYQYFINNFNSIYLRFKNNEEILGCSAEGHVSHILSNRLSSRPMGWSIKGCDSISKLIAYCHNGNKIKDLFHRERKLNYDIINFKDIQQKCINRTKTDLIKKTNNRDLNKYYDIYQSELTIQGKKLLKMGLFK